MTEKTLKLITRASPKCLISTCIEHVIEATRPITHNYVRQNEPESLSRISTIDVQFLKPVNVALIFYNSVVKVIFDHGFSQEFEIGQ